MVHRSFTVWACAEAFSPFLSLPPPLSLSLFFFFCFFLRPPWLSRAYSGIIWNISLPSASLWTKCILTAIIDDVISGRRDLDPCGWLRAVQGLIGYRETKAKHQEVDEVQVKVTLFTSRLSFHYWSRLTIVIVKQVITDKVCQKIECSCCNTRVSFGSFIHHCFYLTGKIWWCHWGKQQR